MASPFYGLKPVSVFNFVEGFAVLLRRKILRLYFFILFFLPPFCPLIQQFCKVNSKNSFIPYPTCSIYNNRSILEILSNHEVELAAVGVWCSGYFVEAVAPVNTDKTNHRHIDPDTYTSRTLDIERAEILD